MKTAISIVFLLMLLWQIIFNVRLLWLTITAPDLSTGPPAPSRAGLAHAAYVARLEDSLYAKTSRAALADWNNPIQK